jgi:Right handed beta helix region
MRKSLPLLLVLPVMLSPALQAFAAQGSVPATTACSGYTLTPADAPKIPSIVSSRPGGTTFCFKPGTYRMTGTITPRNNDRLVGAGTSRGDVVLSGAKVIASWASASGLYVHTGDVKSLPQGGTCLTGTECERSDWLFKNGVMLTRVLSPCSATKVVAGHFCIDYGTSKMYMHDNPSGLTIEYSYVQHAVVASASGVVVQDMTIARYANTAQTAAVLVAANGWVVNNIRATANHGCAVSVIGNGTVVKNSRLDNNGQEGFCGAGSVSAQFTNNEVDRNNLLKFFLEGGGGKFGRTSSMTISGNNFHDNDGRGLWLDIDNVNTFISGNTASHNLAFGRTLDGDGILVEISCYVTVVGNVATGNQGGGIDISSSHDVIVGTTSNPNRVTVPADGQFGIRILANGRAGTTPNCGLKADAKNNHVTGNSITMPAGASYNGVFQMYSSVVSGNSFQANDYHMPSGGCSAARWKWWDGSLSADVPFRGSGKSWQGTFKQDLATSGTC